MPAAVQGAQLPPLAVGAGEDGVQVLAEHQLSPPEGPTSDGADITKLTLRFRIWEKKVFFLSQ